MYNKENKPIVSIILITYKSALFILETLESIISQTYENIELIVSDDASTDNTVEICNVWIEKNKSRFVRTELISVPYNTGISANCNRGFTASQGEWVKFLAGDDTLENDCISSFVDKVFSLEEEVHALHSDINKYLKTFERRNLINTSTRSQEPFNHPEISAEEQFSILVRRIMCPYGPTSFIKRATLKQLGGFDENLPFEDGPLWFNLTGNGYKIHFLDKAVVNYRYHNSVSNSPDKMAIFKPYYKQDKIVFNKLYRRHLSLIEAVSWRLSFRYMDYFSVHGWNKRTPLHTFLFNIVEWPNMKFRAFNNILVLAHIRNNISRRKIF
jgi:glycosyltransferase involved in cell wall biosynthesis